MSVKKFVGLPVVATVLSTLLVCGLLAGGCESGYTVEYDIPGDIVFLDVENPEETEPQPDTTKPELEPDIIYPTLGILEYYESTGDDGAPCQGFKDESNTIKNDQCNFEMSYHQDRTFKVRYWEEDVPVPSQEVQWELLNAEDPDTSLPIATIDAKSSGTNAEGLASVKVTTSDIMGQFVLKATAVNPKFKVPPLYFNIAVVPKQVAPLTVKFIYDGKVAFDVIKAYLFLQDVHSVPACADLDPTGNLPIADKASAEMNDITQSAKFMGFADLTPDNPLMFTIVATGYKVNGPVLIYGCDDVEGLIEFGKSKVVTIALKDIPPKYKGKYAIINHFDMLSALPDDIEQVVNIVIDFFNNPTAGLMEITCVLKDQAATLEDLCENFFADPDNPDINNLTYLGTVVSQVLNTILYSLLEDNIGSDIIFTGKDVGNILKDLEIHSTITLKEEPNAAGIFTADTTEEEWHTLSIQWTLGEDCNPQDPDCGLKSFSFNAIGQDVVIANFEAYVDGYMEGTFDKLVIKPHSLNFKYGAFLNFIIQKLVLPMIAGDGSDGYPVVDSYEKFFGSLMGGKECLQLNNCCTVFSEAIIEDPSLSWAQALIKTGCELLIPAAAGYLESFLLGLDADTGDAFTLATKGASTPDDLLDDEPCTLYDALGNDQIIDTWGKAEPADLRCHWDVLLKLGSEDIFFDAEFWGTRQQ